MFWRTGNPPVILRAAAVANVARARSGRRTTDPLDATLAVGHSARALQANETGEPDGREAGGLAIFPNEAAADTAAQSLKEWDKLDDDVKLNAIGVLVLDDNGKVKTQKMGRRSWGKGAGIGVILAALTPVGLLAGAIGGGLIGALHHKGLGIDSDERERLSAALDNGQAAVGALVNSSVAAGVMSKLAELGGDAHVLSPSDEAVAEVDAVAPQVEAAEATDPTTSP